MIRAFGRMRPGGNRWPAELALRAGGIALLGVAGLLARRELVLASVAPAHPAGLRELAVAAGVFACASLGLTIAALGSSLLRSYHVPSRWARFGD